MVLHDKLTILFFFPLIDKTIEFCKAASMTSGRSTPARGFSFDVTRPSTKDNQGSGRKDGKEAWEIDDGPSSSERESFFFLQLFFCEGKAVTLTFPFG